jgi:SAM-dependent methyltransferase
MALADVPTHGAVLEVGCGPGSFLELARKKRHADVAGIDLNEAAVKVAHDLDRPVRVANVADVAAESPARFDVVCAFQVLEHVPDPRAFLESCVALLKPGGCLCLGVPNNDSYLGRQPFERALLNHPPHHVTRWSPRALMSLASLFPLTLKRLQFEPLEPIHVPEYLTTQLDSLGVLGRFEVVRSRGARLWSIALRKLGLRRLVRGHTVYASFIRTAAAAGRQA